MEVKQATKNFSIALTDLIEAVVEKYISAKTNAILGKNEEKGGETVTWPKTFSVFFKGLSDSDKATIPGQILKDSSCTCWTPNKITLLVMGASESGAKGVSEENIEDIRELLKGELNFDGELTVSVTQTGKKAVAGRPPKKETTTITIDMLKQACVSLSKKLNNKQVVLDLLAEHGGSKISEIPESNYPALMNAIENYGETTTSAGDDEF